MPAGLEVGRGKGRNGWTRPAPAKESMKSEIGCDALAPRAAPARRSSRCPREEKIILSVAPNTTFGGCAPKPGVRRFCRFARTGGEGVTLWRRMEPAYVGVNE